MRPAQLKRQARGYILAYHRPNLFWVTALYLLLGTLLLLLVANLSEISRFNYELIVRSTLALQSLLSEVVAHVLEMSTFSVLALQGIWAEVAYGFEMPTLSPTLFGLFFFFVPYLFIWSLDLGYLYYARGIIKGEKTEPPLGYRTLFEGFNYFKRLILIRVFLAVVVNLGLFLLVFPGLWAMCAFSQAQLLLLDNPDRSALWCLRESNRLMRGHKWSYFLLRLSFLGWYLLSMFPFLRYAAQIWYLPYSTFALVGYYNALTGNAPPPEAQWRRPGMF
jgi:uncharacterized membrane protein